jgi:hypothetical protein
MMSMYMTNPQLRENFMSQFTGMMPPGQNQPEQQNFDHPQMNQMQMMQQMGNGKDSQNMTFDSPPSMDPSLAPPNKLQPQNLHNNRYMVRSMCENDFVSPQKPTFNTTMGQNQNDTLSLNAETSFQGLQHNFLGKMDFPNQNFTPTPRDELGQSKYNQNCEENTLYSKSEIYPERKSNTKLPKATKHDDSCNIQEIEEESSDHEDPKKTNQAKLKTRPRLVPLDAVSITDGERSSHRSESYSQRKNLELAEVMGCVNGLSGMRGKKVEEVVEEFEEYQYGREGNSPMTVVVRESGIELDVKFGMVNDDSCKFYKQEKITEKIEVGVRVRSKEETDLEDSRVDFRLENSEIFEEAPVEAQGEVFHQYEEYSDYVSSQQAPIEDEWETSNIEEVSPSRPIQQDEFQTPMSEKEISSSEESETKQAADESESSEKPMSDSDSEIHNE